MATTNSAFEFGQKIINYGDTITKVNKTAVIAAAVVYKTSALASGARFTGGDLRFSRWKGRQGPKMGAGFEVTGTVQATAILKAKPFGIWWLLEDGAQAHVITPKSKRRGRAKALHIGSGDAFAASANHPGRRGTSAWSLGIKAGTEPAIQAYKRTQIIALAEAN